MSHDSDYCTKHGGDAPECDANALSLCAGPYATTHAPRADLPMTIRSSETQTAFASRFIRADAWDECYARYFGGADEENPYRDALSGGPS